MLKVISKNNSSNKQQILPEIVKSVLSGSNELIELVEGSSFTLSEFLDIFERIDTQHKNALF